MKIRKYEKCYTNDETGIISPIGSIIVRKISIRQISNGRSPPGKKKEGGRDAEFHKFDDDNCFRPQQNIWEYVRIKRYGFGNENISRTIPLSSPVFRYPVVRSEQGLKVEESEHPRGKDVS